jgi:PAS domain S-box-containing protein
MERRQLHFFRKLYPLFQAYPGFVLLLDLDRRIRFVNADFRNRFGEPEGRPLDEICPSLGEAGFEWPGDGEIAPWKWEGLMPDGRPYSICFLPFTEEGGFPHVLVLGIRITERRHTDQALRKVSEILERRIEERAAELSLANEALREEIEELRNAEEELRRACEDLRAENEALRRAKAADDAERRRLAESIEFYRNVSCALPIVAVSYDSEGRATLWNAAAEALSGWRTCEVLGRFDPTVPEEEVEAFLSLLGRVLGGKTVSGLKVCRRRKDGSRIDLSISLAPVRDAEGKIRGCAAILVEAAQDGPKTRQRPSRTRRSRGAY